MDLLELALTDCEKFTGIVKAVCDSTSESAQQQPLKELSIESDRIHLTFGEKTKKSEFVFTPTETKTAAGNSDNGIGN
jgi:hypothetical protein